jgi:hypothetical protein
MVISLYKSSASTLTFIYLFCQDKYLYFSVLGGHCEAVVKGRRSGWGLVDFFLVAFPILVS